MPANLLAACPVTAFVMTAHGARARAFYEGTLGLRCLAQDRFAVVFETQGGQLRAVIAEAVTPAPHTVLGWSVPAIADAVRAFTASGIEFQRYPGLVQDELGIWTSPSGARVAWFKDPDGNVLSLTQAPIAPAPLP